jgi:putative flippase GtrA
VTASRGEFLRFCAVGTLGFIVDAGVTLLLTQLPQWSALRSRVAAFAVAATVTWCLNRSFTFRARKGLGTWLPYLAMTAAGAMINISIYIAWINWIGQSSIQLLLGVVLGSASALGFNYSVSKRVIFKAA